MLLDFRYFLPVLLCTCVCLCAFLMCVLCVISKRLGCVRCLYCFSCVCVCIGAVLFSTFLLFSVCVFWGFVVPMRMFGVRVFCVLISVPLCLIV